MADVAGWLRHASAAVAGRRPPFVLCYHGVGHESPDPHGLFVTPEAFGEHLDVLRRSGYALVTLSELAKAMEDDPTTTGLGAITFDDGLADTMRAALDIARSRDARLTAYIPSGLMGLPHPDLPGRRITTAAEVAELADAGVEIGAHTVDHVDLNAVGAPAAREQLVRSRQTLEDLLGRPVTSVAYPYGRFTRETEAIAEQAGYRWACACSGPGPWRSHAIPREPVFPSVNARRLRLKVAGLYGPVHAVAGVRARLR